MANALRIKKNSAPRQEGEVARLKVVNGPDYGSIFIIFTNSVTIGRGEENDIVISDLKSSRSHAGLGYTAQGWQIRDFGSANGISVNGMPRRDALLKNNETITIGETTFEFIASTDVGTQILSAPPKTLNQIQSEQAAFLAQQQKIRGSGPFGLPGLGGRGQGDKKRITQRPAVILAIVALMATILFTGDEENKQRAAKVAREKEKTSLVRELASTLPPNEEGSKSINKAAETFFKAGFREYRERNFLRARVQFETVLQIMPGHSLARMYLDNSNKAITDEVMADLESGKRSLSAGKVKEARNYFEQITRLLYRSQTDPAFIEAKDQLEKIDKESKRGGQ